MTRTNVWNACNRVLDDKWREASQQSHRARLDSIHGGGASLAHSPSRVTVTSTASTTTFKALPKSKSPAAKSRQAEIERENMKLIKKIVELQSKKHSTNASTASKRRTRPASGSRTKGQAKARAGGYTYHEPNTLTGLATGGSLGVPTSQAHVLYTHRAATMTHHFPSQNDVAFNFHPGLVSNASSQRRRTKAQLHDENCKLLQRILSSKTTFSRAKWQEEERERRKLLSNISRFSHLTKRHSSPSSSPSSKQLSVGGPSELTISGVYGSSSAAPEHHSLAIVGADGTRIIRTGSPVTHLRHRVRPSSATHSPPSAVSRHVMFADEEEGDDELHHHMTALGLGEDEEDLEDDENVESER